MTLDTGSRLLCTKCGSEPRLPKQRWGRKCLTQYKIDRYWRLRAVVQADEAPVTPVPVVAKPLVLCYLCGYSD
jgi:hypothetical protein